jgi:hypothetical protein
METNPKLRTPVLMGITPDYQTADTVREEQKPQAVKGRTGTHAGSLKSVKLIRTRRITENVHEESERRRALKANDKLQCPGLV